MQHLLYSLTPEPKKGRKLFYPRLFRNLWLAWLVSMVGQNINTMSTRKKQ